MSVQRNALQDVALRCTAGLLAACLSVQPVVALAQQAGGSDEAAPAAPPPTPQPTANAEAEAKGAYLKGEDAFKLGHYTEAIQFFEDSYRLSHKIEILFNIGLANRKAYALENKPEYLRRALDIYKQFLRGAADDQERRAARQNISEVSDQLAAIDERERVQRLRTGSGPPALQAALKLYSEGKPSDALNQLEVLLHKGSNPVVVLQDIYRLEGEIGVEAGQSALSLEAYKRLLALAPSYELPKTASAAAHASLEKARAFWSEHGTFSISPVVPPPAVPDQPLAIPVLVENDVLGLVTRLTVRYRRGGTKRFSAVSRSGAGDITIPAMALPSEDDGYRMEYFIQATDTNNNLVTTIGGDTAPLSFPVLSPEEVKKLEERTTPWYGSWWFWTGTSILVAGATVGVLAAAGVFSSGAPNTEFGNVLNVAKNNPFSR